MLALNVAASASSPRNRPIHTALTELFSDCRMLTPSDGSAKRNKVLATGPVVRSRWDLGAVIGGVMAKVAGGG